MPIFGDEYSGFLEWRVQHPNGYVLETTRPPNPNYLLLHSADCGNLNSAHGNSKQGQENMKVCSVRFEDIELWVNSQGMGRPRIESCAVCQPDPIHEAKWWPWRRPNLRYGRDSSSSASEKNMPVFSQRVSFRPLTVIVDAALLHGPPGEGTHLGFLLELLEVKPVRRFFFSEDGLPSDVQTVRLSWYESVIAPGWLVQRPSNHSHLRDVYYLEDETVHSTSYWLEDPRHKLLDIAQIPESYGLLEDPYQRMRSDLHCLLAAEAVDADLLVTDRDLLLTDEFGLARETSVVGPTDAIPIVGMYLRHQNVFSVGRPFGIPETFDRGLFFEAAMRDVLPESWSWAGGCALRYQTTDEADLVFLPGAALSRIERALRARDRLLLATSVPQDGNIAEDIVSELDQICLWLMAALDATAQIAHIVLGLDGELRDAAWQRDGQDGTGGWLKKVRLKEKGLADLVSRGSSGKRVLTILGELRNTIHGQTVLPTQVEDGHRRPELFVLIPYRRRGDVLKAVDAEGGRSNWGIYGLADSSYRVHPAEFADHLISRTTQLLNEIMAATPVENLLIPGQLEHLPRRPSDPGNRFSEFYGTRIRWQLGLD